MLPALAVAALEQSLRGVEYKRAALLTRLSEVYFILQIQSPVVTPDDLTQAILTAGR